jgi:hypothetical protein
MTPGDRNTGLNSSSFSPDELHGYAALIIVKIPLKFIPGIPFHPADIPSLL